MSRMLDFPTPTVVIPPLESGDRLTRAEFEHRYEAMPKYIKAELIEGIVYMASPVRAKNHGRPHGIIMTWLGTYCAATIGLDLLDNTTVRLDIDNEVQPDALLRIDESHGGQALISSDDYVVGAPELVVEIAASSAAYDLHDKFHVYRRNGVQEYVVWTMYPLAVRWYRLHEGVYALMEADDQGVIRSRVFPGLDLDVPALLASDMGRVVAAVHRGLQTPEHASFVAHLAERAASDASGS